MRAALAHAAALLTVTPTGPPVWGWRGRTIGSAALDAYEYRVWLRVLSAASDTAGDRIWTGTAAAAAHIPTEVSRPYLVEVREWTGGGAAYRAELTSYVSSPACSVDSILREDLDLPASWWSSLRASLATIAAVPTSRQALSAEYLARALPQYLSAPDIATTPPRWSTAHGDMHWANITAVGPVLLDWEGWGLAPAGYDAALLAVHSMLVPAMEARVRCELAEILDTPEGRFAELAVLAELLQTTTRGDNLDLAPAMTRRAAQLVAGGR